jgi:hypothetical protein
MKCFRKNLAEKAKIDEALARIVDLKRYEKLLEEVRRERKLQI